MWMRPKLEQSGFQTSVIWTWHFHKLLLWSVNKTWTESMSVVFIASLRGWIQKNDIWPHQNKKVALYVPLVPVLTCMHLLSIASVLLNCRECREQGGFISVHRLRLFTFLFDHLNAKQYILFLCAEVRHGCYVQVFFCEWSILATAEIQYWKCLNGDFRPIHVQLLEEQSLFKLFIWL